MFCASSSTDCCFHTGCLVGFGAWLAICLAGFFASWLWARLSGWHWGGLALVLVGICPGEQWSWLACFGQCWLWTRLVLSWVGFGMGWHWSWLACFGSGCLAGLIWAGFRLAFCWVGLVGFGLGWLWQSELLLGGLVGYRQSGHFTGLFFARLGWSGWRWLWSHSWCMLHHLDLSHSLDVQMFIVFA